MLCKAVAMGDEESFVRIAAAERPGQAKSLGRMVCPWNEEVWQAVVCGVAREVVYQKFKHWSSARRDLLRTGDKLLAEVTRNDQVRNELAATHAVVCFATQVCQALLRHLAFSMCRCGEWA